MDLNFGKDGNITGGVIVDCIFSSHLILYYSKSHLLYLTLQMLNIQLIIILLRLDFSLTFIWFDNKRFVREGKNLYILFSTTVKLY